MNQRTAYAMGRDRGLFFAEVEITEEQEKAREDIDALSSIELNDLQEDILNAAYESESEGRSFTPFEFTAHELNEYPNSEGLWGSYEEGVNMGIKKGLKARFPEVFGGTKRRAKKRS